MLHRTSAFAGIIVLGFLTAAAAAQASATSKAPKPSNARECMARAMYFESNRTAEDGMLAVGTVVANRLASGRYGSSVCEVVSQKYQFAPGVLSRPMKETGPAARARRMAEAVLAGRRHPVAGEAMYFHTANVPFRHDDKRYVLVAGGNAFYDWNRKGEKTANAQSLARAYAAASVSRGIASRALATLDRRAPAASRDAAVALVAQIGSPAEAAAAAPAPLPRDEAAKLALNYAEVAPPAAETRKGLRVIAPTAPVFASAGPVFARSAPPPPAFELPASTRSPLANLVVAQSWAAFEQR